jgi:site-specific DNA-methyltransferase (adenine-specific)
MTVELHHSDFREAQIKAESVDLILTDPPYGKKYMYLWDALGALGQMVLKPGGWLIAYAGQSHLDMEMAGLGKWLSYYWTLSLQLKQGQQVYTLRTMWKPVLVFYKPPKARHGFIHDTIMGSGEDKRFHRWGQSALELRQLIGAFTKEGDMVLDPMAGGGTTIETCIQSGRNVTAYEINDRTFATLKARLEGNMTAVQSKLATAPA